MSELIQGRREIVYKGSPEAGALIIIPGRSGVDFILDRAVEAQFH